MGSRWPDTLAGLERQVLADARISAEDVLELRRTIYRNGGIDRSEAEFLFHLNRESRDNDPAWAEFFVEALTDFFYWREGSDSRLSPQAEEMLLGELGNQLPLDDACGLRLLLSVVFRTNGASERLRTFALESVRHSMLHGEHALFGDGARRPGAIDRADVEAIRRLVYGLGSYDGLAIGRKEAEFLFDLNNRTAGARNDPAWRELFVKALAMYLLFAGDSPDRVDEPEARWLLAQIDADREPCENERALLAYLKQEAASLHPSLSPLCQRLGV